MPATKLKVVEDLFSTDLDGSVRGGCRFEQIGPSASCKLLESLLENDLPGKISGLLVLDLSLGVGDLFWAWLERVKAMKFPILYVAASADPTAVEWVQHTIQEELTEKLLSGDVVLPGFHVRPKDAPAEVLASAPPPPQLNVCVLQQGVLAVPQVVVQQWAAHPTFGTEFQQLLADHIAEFGEAPPEKAGSSGQANSCPEPSPKKRRTTAPLKSESVDNLPAVKLAQAAVVGLKTELLGKIMIRVSTDRSWLLVNVSQNVVALPAGTVLAGFGPGTFKHAPRLAEGKIGLGEIVNECRATVLPLTSATTARSLPHPMTRSTLSWSASMRFTIALRQRPMRKLRHRVMTPPTWSSRGPHPWLLWCRSPLASSSTAASCGQ